MEMFFFNVTYRVTHGQGRIDVISYKAFRAPSEHEARRSIMNEWIDRGYNVRRIERIVERGRKEA